MFAIQSAIISLVDAWHMHLFRRTEMLVFYVGHVERGDCACRGSKNVLRN